MTVDGTIERTGIQRDKEQGWHYNLIITEPLRGLWIPSQIKMRTVNWTSPFLCISGFVHLFSSSYLSFLMWGSQFFFFPTYGLRQHNCVPKKLKRKAPFWNLSLWWSRDWLWMTDGWETTRLWDRETGGSNGKEKNEGLHRKEWICLLCLWRIYSFLAICLSKW